MTNPDREELMKLADELIAQNYGNVRDIDTMGEHFALLAKAASALRRLASSDGGVKVRELAWHQHPDGESQRYEGIAAIGNNYVVFKAWWGLHHKWGWVGSDNGFFHTEEEAKAACQADYEARIRAALITARPADAGMREAFVRVIASLAAAISILERTPKAKKAVASDKMFDTMLDDYRKALEAGRAALTAPGATTKSDGGVCAYCNGKGTALYFSEQSYSHETRPCHVCRPSDPSSTRSEVTALASLQGEDAVERVARAICQSGKFETGQGTCALICMDQLGDVRKKGCSHCIRVHGAMARAILATGLVPNKS